MYVRNVLKGSFELPELLTPDTHIYRFFHHTNIQAKYSIVKELFYK